MNNTNTPYDDVFRTLLTDCSHLIFPVLNEAFDETYEGYETIVLKNNEHYLSQKNSKQSKRITDSSFLIIQGQVQKYYHIECQSTPDGSMILRMFEYDSQIALQNSQLDRTNLTVNFPHSAIIYLRHTKHTPDNMQITINTPGGNISYTIPSIKIQTYSLDTLFKKKLLFLIPFYIFTYESQLNSIENSANKLDTLCKEYAIIRERLETLSIQGHISEYTLKTICDMSEKVIQHLASKYEKIKKEVTSIMGGKVLEYEAKTIYREGIKDGIDQGIELLSSLLKLLIEAGRINDATLAMNDKNARQTFFEEFDLLK